RRLDASVIRPRRVPGAERLTVRRVEAQQLVADAGRVGNDFPAHAWQLAAGAELRRACGLRLQQIHARAPGELAETRRLEAVAHIGEDRPVLTCAPQEPELRGGPPVGRIQPLIAVHQKPVAIATIRLGPLGPRDEGPPIRQAQVAFAVNGEIPGGLRAVCGALPCYTTQVRKALVIHGVPRAPEAEYHAIGA